MVVLLAAEVSEAEDKLCRLSRWRLLLLVSRSNVGALAKPGVGLEASVRLTRPDELSPWRMYSPELLNDELSAAYLDELAVEEEPGNFEAFMALLAMDEAELPYSEP